MFGSCVSVSSFLNDFFLFGTSFYLIQIKDIVPF